MRFGGFLLCNATSNPLETGWVTPWGSGLSIWIETPLWKQGVSFYRAIQYHRQNRYNMRFGGLSYVMKHQILLKLAEWHIGAMDCQSELKLVCGNREFPFLELSKITVRKGQIWDLRLKYEIMRVLCNVTLDPIETGWVTPWGNGLSIWIETSLWKQGVLLIRAIQNQRQNW